ncbi:eukaryotic translation initiation factor eIF2A-domain-containing protein [Schizophyllum amplum]|uniref:Eukaryotic translation initiation factor 2A n=1 Tax=Schizophyllum amplum TaxID=97359 RepID=A0A550BZ72_9AGAR|nr:eukaryotic translation initiation factor eIF2A-domain-containing protein [Auriculariopsis ampla]
MADKFVRQGITVRRARRQIAVQRARVLLTTLVAAEMAPSDSRYAVCFGAFNAPTLQHIDIRWLRAIKLDDSSQHKNHRVFSVSTGEELTSFSQRSQEGWDMQYTISESHAIRLVGPEIQVFCPSEWSKGIVDKLCVDTIPQVNDRKTCLHRSERPRRPSYASRISQDEPGRASPHTHVQYEHGTRREGNRARSSTRTTTPKYITGDTVKRVHAPPRPSLHNFGTAYISFNPQGRLMALAGFGNLAGKITIVDRRTLNKVTTIDAPNTSVCQWSPDGRFLLTATLSPRLRVDNGVMIWHCTGPLMHVQRTEELYQTGWRPARTEDVPPFPAQIPPAPAPSPSASQVAAAAKPVVSKGAYRPPGARGLAAPSIFKREDEGGAPRIPTNGTHSPQGVRSPEPRGVPGAGARRHVPGAPPPNHSPSPGPGDKKKRKGKKGGEEGGASGAATPTDGAATPIKGRRGGSPRGSMDGRPKPRTNGSAANVRDAAPPPAEEPQTDPSLDPVAKKVRNLTKKLKAIEELKEKAMRGERLEATQVKKIDGEGALKAELASLGA